MARETMDIQCHPDYVDEKIRKYEMWGWEVIGNQRCQEKERRGDTVYTTTFNKITFSRDKAAPWYKRVTELENSYYYILEKKEKIPSYCYYSLAKEYGYTGEEPKLVTEPKIYRPGKFFAPLISFIIFAIVALIGFMKFGDFFPSVPDFVGTVVGVAAAIAGGISFIVMLCNISKLSGLKGEEATKALEEYREKATKSWNDQKAVEKFLNDKVIEIVEEAESLING